MGPAGHRVQVEAMDLEPLRKQVDALDGELVSLLNRRAQIVVQIGKLKGAGGNDAFGGHLGGGVTQVQGILQAHGMPSGIARAVGW